ncbi:hypothetical protein GOBAR_DD19725 [Gossypium barbadense]|nr:hypothetical protein GOBAR_DD19725 [Gossypium barbadense]
MRRLGRANSKTPLLGHSCEKGTIKHSFPMKYFLKPWKLGRWFYQVVKFGIVQYMIIKISTALLAVILEAFGMYCEGEFNWECGYPYMALIIVKRDFRADETPLEVPPREVINLGDQAVVEFMADLVAKRDTKATPPKNEKDSSEVKNL